MTATCPHCGWSLVTDAPPIQWDAAAGKIVSARKSITLTRGEARVFDVLWRNRGEFISTEKLDDAVYADRFDGGAVSNTTQVHISRMREKFRGAPIAIESKWGFGYRVAVGDT